MEYMEFTRDLIALLVYSERGNNETSFQAPPKITGLRRKNLSCGYKFSGLNFRGFKGNIPFVSQKEVDSLRWVMRVQFRITFPRFGKEKDEDNRNNTENQTFSKECA
jgi:hypothetical protein